MQVVKRNQTLEDFSIEKIINAVNKAFKSVNLEMPKRLVKNIYSTFTNLEGDTIGIEELQDKVELLLMEGKYYKVAKAFILYREKHNQVRNFTSKKKNFITNYIASDNTANATIDDNANVSNHNIAVLNSELHKEDNQQINYRLWRDKIKELYPNFNYKQFDEDINTKMYPHDSSSQVGMPYCVAITIYPFLTNGIKDIGGLSGPPQHLSSFCTMFTNLVFGIAAQFKGAVAVPGWILAMSYFCEKKWGNNFHLKKDTIISSEHDLEKKTIEQEIDQWFQTICYTLMQPTAARSSQAVFWNTSIFDKEFYNSMYGDFAFPDGTKPNWESFNWLQKHFLHWLNQERLKCILTFPVCSVAMIYKDGEFADKDMYDFVCQEYSEGNSFFTYISDSADSLSSCCRLSSKIEKPQFNFTNGQLSEQTGSKNVITLNLNRIIQDWAKELIKMDFGEISYKDIHNNPKFIDHVRDSLDCKNFKFKDYLITILERVYKYHTAYNEILKDLHKNKMLSVYNAGFINMKKQYLTIGINGLNQSAEFLGIKCNKNEDYKEFCNFIFTTIKEQNQKHKTKELMFNTEFTPCESAALKLYNRDKKDGYWVPEDTNLYASYIFKPNDTDISILDKIYLHGNDFCGDNLDGGSAAHLGLEEHLDKEQYHKIITYAAKVGCKYFTFNVPNSECQDCGYITKVPISKCPKCGSTNIDMYDRIIGYLVKIKNWVKGRQIEQKTRVYTPKDKINA